MLAESRIHGSMDASERSGCLCLPNRDHGVGWNVAWKRFPDLTMTATIDTTTGPPTAAVTNWFGGLIYVDIDPGLLGKTLRCALPHCFNTRAPRPNSFRHMQGTHTREDDKIQEHSPNTS